MLAVLLLIGLVPVAGAAESEEQLAPLSSFAGERALGAIFDLNVALVIANELGVHHTDEVTQAQLSTITALDLTMLGPVNLRGVQYLSGLTSLAAHSNTLSPLSGLINLTHLDLRDSGISNISALSGLTNLTSLHLGDNQIRDISPLSGLTLSQGQLQGQTIELGARQRVSPLTVQNVVIGLSGGLVQPFNISNGGIWASPNITWTGLAGNVTSVSYEFGSMDGGILFSGTVTQPLTAPPVTAPTGVTITSTPSIVNNVFSLNTGATRNLTATVAPSGANQTVTWTSSNTTVATVNANGVVTAGAAGSAVIRATAAGTTIFREVTVTVVAGNAITLTPSGNHTFPSANVGYSAPPAAHTVTVRNAGTAATGQLTVALSGTNANRFTLSRTTIPGLAVNTTQTFTVRPNSGIPIGTHTATVTVSGANLAPQSFTVTFQVTDANSVISLSPSGNHTFPSAGLGYATPPAAHTVTVQNTGGAATGQLTVALSGTNANRFTLSRTTIPSLAANATQTFTVRPNSGLPLGTHTATVTVSSANGASQSFTVTFQVINATTTISLTPSGNHTFPSAGHGYATPPAAHTVTVQNTGGGATGQLTVALSGTNANRFTLSRTTIPSLAANATQTFTVRPNSGLPIGTHTATVTVSSASVASRSFNVTFQVTEAAPITLTPAGNHTFPSAMIGYATPPAAHTITVHNTGTEAIGQLTVALSGANANRFTLSRTTIPGLLANATQSFTVRPNANLPAGTHTATVTVSGSVVTQAFPAQTLVVSFTVTEGAHPFTDISSPNVWYAAAVQFMYERNLMRGVTDTTFAPAQNLTRAEVATILWRVAGEPFVTFQNVFHDVPAGAPVWYRNAVIWANQNGIILGSDGYFNPYGQITREQFAAMLYRYAQFIGSSTSVPGSFQLQNFEDRGDVSDWAERYMRWAVHTGMITGTSSTMLSPHGTASRAQCATILMRFIVEYKD